MLPVKRWAFMLSVLLHSSLYSLGQSSKAALCNQIGWAEWSTVGGENAVGNINLQEKNISVTMSASFSFEWSPAITHSESFNRFRTTIPKTPVPRTSWASGAGTITICFSEAVKEPVLLLASLGDVKGSVQTTISFSEPYVMYYNGGGARANDSHVLSGREGYVIVKFPGDVKCITISSTTAETFTDLTLGIPVCPEGIPKAAPIVLAAAEPTPPVAPIPEPKPAPVAAPVIKPAPVAPPPEPKPAPVAAPVVKVAPVAPAPEPKPAQIIPPVAKAVITEPKPQPPPVLPVPKPAVAAIPDTVKKAEPKTAIIAKPPVVEPKPMPAILAPQPPPTILPITKPVASAPVPKPIAPKPAPVEQPQKVLAAATKPIPSAAVPKPPSVPPKPAAKTLPLPTVASLKDNRLKIKVWDYSGMDYDSVSIKLNGKQVGPKSILLHLDNPSGLPEFTYPIDLQPGDNTLEIYAIGEGLKPYTTVGLMIMYDGKPKKLYFALKAKETTVVHL